MTAGLDGKTVLVTGGAHGIGLETAREFARDGAGVFLFDRDCVRPSHPRSTSSVGELRASQATFAPGTTSRRRSSTASARSDRSTC